MSLDFVAIDFETASYERGSACAVGLTVVRNGCVAGSFYTLLNPKVPFAPQCIRIHGIREADVKSAPTFPEAWDEMRRHMGQLPLIAHNASFDIGVLDRLFSIWRVDPVPVRYACTLRLSRALCPGAPSHRLNDLCDYFRLPDFAHHNAEADARACALLVLEMARRRGADSLDALLRAANLRWSALPVCARTPAGSAARPTAATESAREACAPVFEGISFVFTGELSSMERQAAERAVQLRAGTVLGGVSRKTGVLVVGEQDPRVVRGPCSTKHARALELRDKGCAIEIVGEKVFLDWLRGDALELLRR